MMKLFSKNSNLCDHNSPTLQRDRETDRQTDRRTDRQTTCDRNTALCTKVHRAVKTHLHRVPQKTCDYIFYNNFNSKCPITIIFGIVSSKSMHHRMMYKVGIDATIETDWMVRVEGNLAGCGMAMGTSLCKWCGRWDRLHAVHYGCDCSKVMYRHN